MATALLGIRGIQAPWQQQRQQLERRYKEEVQRSELLSTILSQGSQLKKQEGELLLQGGLSLLTGEVMRLASKAGLQVESVGPQPEVQIGPYTRFQIQLVASSNFTDLLGFLRFLEQEGTLLEVDRLEIGEASSPRTEGLNLARPAPSGKEGSSWEAEMKSLFQEEGRQVGSHRRKVQIYISAFGRKGASV
jgi:Tfp pilus assembly protein PilO